MVMESGRGAAATMTPFSYQPNAKRSLSAGEKNIKFFLPLITVLPLFPRRRWLSTIVALVTEIPRRPITLRFYLLVDDTETKAYIWKSTVVEGISRGSDNYWRDQVFYGCASHFSSKRIRYSFYTVTGTVSQFVKSVLFSQAKHESNVKYAPLLLRTPKVSSKRHCLEHRGLILRTIFTAIQGLCAVFGWDRKLDVGAFSDFTFGPNPSMVSFDKVFANDQSKTRSLFVVSS